MASKAKGSDCVVSLQALQEMISKADDMTKVDFGHEADVVARAVSAINDPAAVNKFISDSKVTSKIGRGVMHTERVLFEIFVNNLIGGLGTGIINLAANKFMVAYEMTKSAATVGSAAITLNKESLFTESRIFADQFMSIGRVTKNAAKLAFTKGKGWDSTNLPVEYLGTHDYLVAAKAGGSKAGSKATSGRYKNKEGVEVELPEAADERTISSNYWGVNPDSRGGKSLDYLGAFINAPGEGLRHADLYSKSMNYEMELSRLARYRANQLSADPVERQKQFKLYMDHPHEDDMLAAADKANRNTFTNELGQFAAKYRVAMQTPGVRFLTPYFRTLVNIQKMGLNESALGESYRAWKGGTEYFKVLKERTPKGDAARAQAAMSTIIPITVMSQMDAEAKVDGYGFTGYIDMSSPSGRLQAENIAPAYSYKFKSGHTFNFGELEPVGTMLKLYLGVREASHYISMGEDGKPTETGQQLMEIATTPIKNLFGNFVAMDSIQKMSDLVDAMTSDDANAYNNTVRLAADIAKSVIPVVGAKYTKDLNRAAFDDEFRRAHTFLEQLQKDLPGRSEYLGAHKTVWGERKTPRNGWGLDRLHSAFTGERETDKIDLKVAQLELAFKDNPSTVVAPSGGARLDLNTIQTEQYMIFGGQALDMPALGLKVPSLKDTLRPVLAEPSFTQLPEHKQKSILEGIIAVRQKAAAALVFKLNPDLQQQAMQYKQNKAALDRGEIPMTKEVDFAYVQSLFTASQTIAIEATNLGY